MLGIFSPHDRRWESFEKRKVTKNDVEHLRELMDYFCDPRPTDELRKGLFTKVKRILQETNLNERSLTRKEVNVLSHAFHPDKIIDKPWLNYFHERIRFYLKPEHEKVSSPFREQNDIRRLWNNAVNHERELRRLEQRNQIKYLRDRYRYYYKNRYSCVSTTHCHCENLET